MSARQRIAESLARECQAARRDARRTGRSDTYAQVCENVQEGFHRGHLKLSDISIRGLFEALVPDGREAVRLLEPGRPVGLFETDAVKTGDFTNILLHALSGEVLRIHDNVDLIWSGITTTVNTNLERERIPGIGGLGDAAELVNESDPYPIVGEAAEYVDTPITQKRGFIVPITKEAIFFDRTNLVQARAQQAAEWMAINKEKRVISVAVGATNNWNYNGTAYNTYQTGGGSELFDNTVTSNAFVSWKNIRAADRKFADLTDPITGEPIQIGNSRVIVCDPEIAMDVRRVVGATEIREQQSSDPDSRTNITLSANPVSGISVLVSPHVGDLAADANEWFYGDPMRAFRYFQNWGITTDTAGRGSSLDFHNDIVVQYKVSERAVAGVENPRYMMKNT